MSMSEHGLRITIRRRVKPVTDLGSLKDIKRAATRVLRNWGLEAPPKKKGTKQ